MGEGIHAGAASRRGTGRSRKWAIIIAGTAVALLATGILVQFLRPTSAFPDARDDDSTAGAASEARSVKAKSLAKVGRSYITYDQVAAECVQRYGETVLDNLINRLIIAQACQAAGIVVSQDEVEREIGEIAAKFQLTPEQWLQMLRGERNIEPAQYRRDIIWPMIALRKLAGTKVELTEEDMQRAFERNYGEKVKARAIVLDHPRRAAEVWEKVHKNPADFAKLARQYSIDPASRPLDGVVPPIRRHGGSKELEEAAFKLQKGEYSGVIQVGRTNQWVILLCEGHTEQVVKDISEVRDILERDLREEKQQEMVANLFKEIRDRTRVDNYLKNTSTGGEKARAIRQTGATTEDTYEEAASRRSSKPGRAGSRSATRPRPNATR